MTINFILNGEDVAVQASVDARLLDILRRNFKLLEVKTGCLSGKCGVCLVIFNGRVAPSCIIPAFRIRGSEIITIEGFSQTDEYQDIIQGLEATAVEFCGYCTSGKILVISALLDRIPRPNREEIFDAFQSLKCRCTEPESLLQWVMATADIRQRRLYGRGV